MQIENSNVEDIAALYTNKKHWHIALIIENQWNLQCFSTIKLTSQQKQKVTTKCSLRFQHTCTSMYFGIDSKHLEA